MTPTMKKRGKTVLGVRMGLCRLFSGGRGPEWGGDSLIEIAGHLLPCFQSLLPERSIYRVTKLSSDTGQSLEVVVLRRHNGGELTSWPPAFGLLLYLIVVLTIYGICMGLSLRHCAMDVHMSAVKKKDARRWEA